MGKLSSILIIIAVLGSHGNADARSLGGFAARDGVAQRGARRLKAGKARRPGARTRREAATAAPSVTGRRAAPDRQPANLAPQPEDIPPVKPPKKRLPPADKRNPGQ